MKDYISTNCSVKYNQDIPFKYKLLSLPFVAIVVYVDNLSNTILLIITFILFLIALSIFLAKE